MNKERIRIRIAESMGWTNHSSYKAHVVHPWRNPSGLRGLLPPNYPESLDACATFERTLTGSSDDEESERTRYGEALCWVIYETDEPNAVYNVDLATATPRQRCEAYLRVKGLWEEGDELS